MKKIALITSYCDTDEKKNTLVNNIKKLKELNVDVMLCSPIFPLEQYVIDLCDFYFLTKENPILKWPERAYNFWIRIENKHNQQIYLHRFLDDYGWAALYQTKKLAQIAITYDYDIFYHMIYDLNIDDNIINDIQTNVVNRTYHRINQNDISHQWNVNLHFLPLDRNITSFFAENIKKEDYTSISGFAEDIAEKILEPLNLEKSKFPVRDIISYDYTKKDNENLHNYSKNDNYKIFFSRKEDKYKFIIYDIKIDIEKIEVNGLVVEFEDSVPVELAITDLYSFTVYTNNGNIEYTQEFNSSTNLIE
jgi:hypothetical protein